MPGKENKEAAKAALPIKNLKKISLIGLSKFSDFDYDTFSERLKAADVSLADWSEAGIRNRMAQHGACVGLVPPRSPINPLSKVQRKELEGELEERKLLSEIAGSIINMCVCVVTPVIPKDELEAYTMRLVYHACEGEEDTALLPAIQKDCQAVAKGRLMNKTPVSVKFYDLIIDMASEVAVTDISSKYYGHVIRLLAHILEGRKENSNDLIGGAGSSGDKDTREKILPREMYSAGDVYAKESKDTIRTDDIVHSSIFNKMKDVYKVTDEELCNIVNIGINKDDKTNFVNSTVFFTSVMQGALVMFGLNNEWDKFTAEVKRKLDKGEYAGVRKDKVLHNMSLNDYFLDIVEDLDCVPVLKMAVFHEQGKAKFTLPFFIDSDKDDTLNGVTRAALFNMVRSFGVGSATEIRKLELELTFGHMDVYADITSKKAYLNSVTPASPHKRLIPMTMGIEYVDLVDRVAGTIDIFKRNGEALRKVCELCFIFRHVMVELITADKGDN